MKKLILFLISLFLISFQLKSQWSCGEPIQYGEQIYQTIKIGNQCWFAENLNIGEFVKIDQLDNDTIEKFCYDDDSLKCEDYGGLYLWHECMKYTKNAQGICPQGWHIPTSDDWCVLTYYIDNSVKCEEEETGIYVGNKMKSITNWNGTNESGFNAIPAGIKDNASFKGLGEYTSFWHSDTSFRKSLSTISNGILTQYHNYKIASSIRCVKNNENIIGDFYTIDTLVGHFDSIHFHAEVFNGSTFSYKWDFNNDGIIDIDTMSKNVVYVYNDPGIYTISLTLYNDIDTIIITKHNYINVIPIPEICIIYKNVIDYFPHASLLWETESSNKISSYNIYKKFGNNYNIIGNVPYAQNYCQFTDLDLLQQKKYKISAILINGIETNLSKYHESVTPIDTTIKGKLTISKYSTEDNIEFDVYYIYGDSIPLTNNIDPIDSIFSSDFNNNNTYTFNIYDTNHRYFGIRIYNDNCYDLSSSVYITDTKISSIASFNIIESSIGKVKVYPNPIKNYLKIELYKSCKNSILSIYNISGGKINSYIFDKNLLINTENLSKGYYIIEIININGSIKNKILKI